MNRIQRIIDDRNANVIFHVTIEGERCIAHATNVLDAIALHAYASLMHDIPLPVLCIHATDDVGNVIESHEGHVLIDIPDCVIE